MLIFYIIHDIIIIETKKTQNKKREVEKMKTKIIRIYYKTRGEIGGIDDERKEFIDIEVKELIADVLTQEFCKEDFYFFTETAQIEGIIEITEKIRGRYYIRYSISDIFVIE